MSQPLVTTPLSTFTQLSPVVYLYEPAEDDHSNVFSSPSSSKRSSNPKLIILVTWMSAHPLHISKYILGYQAHFPSSRILLIRSSPLDLLYRSTRTQRRWVTPAVSVILSSCTTTNTKPELLLHIFSNGGSHQAHNLLRAYSEINSDTIPSHVTIFDSSPGRSTFKRSVLALSSALPSTLPIRLFLLLIIYVIISVYWIIFVPFGIPDPIERIRQALNDRGLMKRETSRCYIYSEADPMVDWLDVEAHAQDAVKSGFVVRSEKFEGSGHCAHMRVEGGTRYWAIVKEMWQQC